jgi:hypothetical protein
MAIASLFFAASSCSDDLDEEATIQNSNSENTAYLAVSISSPTGGTRAEADEPDANFELGTEDEHAISRADFYFYYADGSFAAHSVLFNTSDKTEIGGTANETVGNIEFESSTVVTVTDLSKGYPTKMVTILNQPKDFEAPETLSGMLSEITGTGNLSADEISQTYISNSSGKFIMTTSSHGTNDEYYISTLTNDDFRPSKADAEARGKEYPVIVYVERLAAKVKVEADKSLETITVDGNTAYKIGTEDWTIKGQETESEPLYAEFLGWGVNGQPAHSYLMKHINTAWTNTDLGFVWNASKYYRSYWAESYNYGDDADSTYDYLDHYITQYKNSYTRAVEELTGTDEASATTTSANKHLLYLSYNELANGMDAAGYCPENTNTSDVLSAVSNYQGAVSCVLIKARLVGADGQGKDVVYYGKQLYTVDQYKTMVLNAMGFSVVRQSNNAPMSASDLILTDADYKNGRVVVAVDPDKSDDATWVSSSDASKTYTLAELNEDLEEFNEEAHAIYYNGGDMYYSIPIEHMRGEAPTKDSIANNNNVKILEGQFGVVRNHIYALTINSIANLGHGVKDPDEPIVPPLEKDQDFYVGVKINILSWHIVSQGVVL